MRKVYYNFFKHRYFCVFPVVRAALPSWLVDSLGAYCLPSASGSPAHSLGLRSSRLACPFWESFLSPCLSLGAGTAEAGGRGGYLPRTAQSHWGCLSWGGSPCQALSGNCRNLILTQRALHSRPLLSGPEGDPVLSQHSEHAGRELLCLAAG